MTYLDYTGLYFLIGTVFAIGLQAWATRKEPRLMQGDFIQGVVLMKTLPKYVRLAKPWSSCLRLARTKYVRDCGAWSVHFKYDDKGVLRIHEPDNRQYDHLHGVELVEITKRTHDIDNGIIPGYRGGIQS